MTKPVVRMLCNHYLGHFQGSWNANLVTDLRSSSCGAPLDNKLSEIVIDSQTHIYLTRLSLVQRKTGNDPLVYLTDLVTNWFSPTTLCNMKSLPGVFELGEASCSPWRREVYKSFWRRISHDMELSRPMKARGQNYFDKTTRNSKIGKKISEKLAANVTFSSVFFP